MGQPATPRPLHLQPSQHSNRRSRRRWGVRPAPDTAMNAADNTPEMAIESISYAEEIDHLVDDLLILQRNTPRIDAGELVIVATCRNHVWDALAALLTHAVGPFRRRPALRSIADLQSAPAAFALDTLRSYPRLPTDSAPAPSDGTRNTAVAPPCNTTQSSTPSAARNARQPCSLMLAS